MHNNKEFSWHIGISPDTEQQVMVIGTIVLMWGYFRREFIRPWWMNLLLYLVMPGHSRNLHRLLSIKQRRLYNNQTDSLFVKYWRTVDAIRYQTLKLWFQLLSSRLQLESTVKTSRVWGRERAPRWWGWGWKRRRCHGYSTSQMSYQMLYHGPASTMPSHHRPVSARCAAASSPVAVAVAGTSS